MNAHLDPVASLFVLGIILAVAFILLLGLLRAADGRLNAARPVAPPAQPAGRAHETCTVPFCDNPVSVHVRAGLDRWPFCLTDGMPYLTGEKSAS